MNKSEKSIAVALLLVGSSLCGCATEPVKLRHFLSSERELLGVTRVVFIEFSQDTGYASETRSMTEAVFRSLQHKDFHIDVMRPTDPACRDLNMDQWEAFSIGQLDEIRQSLKCDAVLFGRMTDFKPYPKLQVGLFMKLINLRSGELVWAIEHIWDSTDKVVEKRVNYFFEKEMRTGYGPHKGRLALISPRMFQKFVAWEVAKTIPCRAEIAEEQRKNASLWAKIGGKKLF